MCNVDSFEVRGDDLELVYSVMSKRILVRG